jgi:hypothetical protein
MALLAGAPERACTLTYRSSALSPLAAKVGAAAPCQSLHGVGVLHALVVAGVGIPPVVGQPGRVIEDLLFAHPASVLVRVALGINVLEGRTHRLSYRQRRAALAGDQDQFTELAFFFQAGEFEDGRVKHGQ